MERQCHLGSREWTGMKDSRTQKLVRAAGTLPASFSGPLAELEQRLSCQHPQLLLCPRWSEFVEVATIGMCKALEFRTDYRPESPVRRRVRKTLQATLEAHWRGASSLYEDCTRFTSAADDRTASGCFRGIADWMINHLTDRQVLERHGMIFEDLTDLVQLDSYAYCVDHHLLPGIAGPGIDLRVYGQQPRPFSHSLQVVGVVLDQPSRRRILSIPHLQYVTIYDGPYACSFYNTASLYARPERFWFVHYAFGEDTCKIGAGTVMVIERGSGRVVYDGTDGGE
jgi:hypothetical protein